MSALAIAKLIYDLIPEKAKEIATERFTDSAIDTAQKLWEKLWGKAQGDAKAEKTLKAVEAGDKEKLDRLKIFLEDLMEDNSEFAEELQKLVQEIAGGVKNDGGKTFNVYGGELNYNEDNKAPVFQGGKENQITINYNNNPTD